MKERKNENVKAKVKTKTKTKTKTETKTLFQENGIHYYRSPSSLHNGPPK